MIRFSCSEKLQKRSAVRAKIGGKTPICATKLNILTDSYQSRVISLGDNSRRFPLIVSDLAHRENDPKIPPMV